MSRKTKLTSRELFDWANKYARNSEAAGRGTEYPTLRMAARRYGRGQEAIAELVDEGAEEGYLGLAVGISTAAGHGLFESRGDCLIEAYA